MLGSRHPRQVLIALISRTVIKISAQSSSLKSLLDVGSHLDGLALQAAMLVARIGGGHTASVMSSDLTDVAKEIDVRIADIDNNEIGPAGGQLSRCPSRAVPV